MNDDSKRKQVFEISGRLIGQNDWFEILKKDRYYRDYRKSYSAKVKSDIEEDIGWFIKASKIKPVTSKVFVRFTWIEPNMKRDFDNISFAKKFIFDALVKMNIIANDGWKNIDGFSDKFRLNRTNPRIIVELEEVEGE